MQDLEIAEVVNDTHIKKTIGLRPSCVSRESGLKEKAIVERKRLIQSYLKCPPALNQFRKEIDSDLRDRTLQIFKKYSPETPKAKKARLKREAEFGKEGPKPVITKFGLKHVTFLIESKRAKLVLIANNVDPIEQVLFLPALCKKLGVPYAIFGSKALLGTIIGRKTATCVCLCDSTPEDGLEKIVGEFNAEFAEKYEEDMKKWGLPTKK